MRNEEKRTEVQVIIMNYVNPAILLKHEHHTNIEIHWGYPVYIANRNYSHATKPHALKG